MVSFRDSRSHHLLVAKGHIKSTERKLSCGQMNHALKYVLENTDASSRERPSESLSVPSDGVWLHHTHGFAAESYVEISHLLFHLDVFFRGGLYNFTKITAAWLCAELACLLS